MPILLDLRLEQNRIARVRFICPMENSAICEMLDGKFHASLQAVCVPIDELENERTAWLEKVENSMEKLLAGFVEQVGETVADTVDAIKATFEILDFGEGEVKETALIVRLCPGDHLCAAIDAGCQVPLPGEFIYVISRSTAQVEDAGWLFRDECRDEL